MAINVFIMAGPDGAGGTDFAMYRPDINEFWDFGAQFSATFPGPERGFGTWHYNGILYAAFGADALSLPIDRNLYSVPLPTAWRDDDYAGTWTDHGTIVGVVQQEGMGTAIAGGYVVLFGGVDKVVPTPDESRLVNDTLLTGLPTLAWSGPVGPIIAERGSLNNTGAVIGNKLYRGGGSSTGSVAAAEWEVFDFDNTGAGWTSLTDIPIAVHSHTTVADGTYVYVMGGNDGGVGKKDVQRYTPGTDTWEVVTDLPATGSRDFAYYHSGVIYFFGADTAVYTYAVSQGLAGGWTTLPTPTNPDSVTFSSEWLRSLGTTTTFSLTTQELQGPFVPVRANARMDALSAARNFDAPPIDIDVSQAFLPEPLVVFDPDILTGFDEALSPGTVEFYYTPLGRQSLEFLQEFTGETMLARMGRTYPPSLMNLVSDITDPVISSNLTADNTVAARYLIEYVFNVWAAQYPWFAYATIPDLRIPILGGTYSGDEGTVYSNVVLIPQTDDNERTMLDIVQELLAPFGAFKTVNDSAQLEIRARYGPDADASPVVTLKDNDLYVLSTGDPSRVGTKNRIVLEKRPFDRAADTPAMQDAYYQIRHSLLPAADMITDRVSDPPDVIPGTRLDLTNGIGSGAFTGYGRGDPLFWPAGSDVVPEGPIAFTSSAAASSPSTVQLDVDFRAIWLPDPAQIINKSLSDSEVTLTQLTDLVLDGEWHLLFVAGYGNSWGTTMSVALDGRWVNTPGHRGIELSVLGSVLFVDTFVQGAFIRPGGWVGSFAITLSDASTVWTARGTSTTVTYGIITGDSPDNLAAPDGSNAIKNSQDARGILEERIRIGPYNPSLETMNLMAEGLLLDKIQPRAIRQAELSVVRAHPIRFSHVGHVVELPDAEQGIVTSRSYSE